MELSPYDTLKAQAFEEGATLFGVADIEPLKDRFLLSKSEMQGLTRGISVALSLSRSVLDGIVNRPTLLYKWHYRQANNVLDRIAFRLTQGIVEKGFRALPIPASQVVDWETQKGHVSHRSIAEAAGLGWRGRNNLVVNSRYGAGIRLVTVLTDMPLIPDRPADQSCGRCSSCVSVCPADALGQSAAEYDLRKCYEHLKEFAKLKGIGQHICGICIKACPGEANRSYENGSESQCPGTR